MDKQRNYTQKDKQQILTSTGTLWGWRMSNPIKLIIKLDDGVVFSCRGMSRLQGQALQSDDLLGRKIAFYHQGFDVKGKPIKPGFKSLVVDKRGKVQ